MFEDLRQLYQEVILDHSRHPRNFHQPDNTTHQAKGDNPLCGDKIIVYLRINTDGVIEEAGFLGKGCAISTASASMMTQLIKNKKQDEVRRVFDYFHHLCTQENSISPDNQTVHPEAMEKLQVLSGVRQFPVRVKCATLPWHAMVAAMEGKQSISTEETFPMMRTQT